jgi:hypothetical protein
MSDNTIIQQGSFTSTGAAVNIPLRSGVDWMKVYNTTVAAASQTTAIGVEYYWQAGFPAGYAWEYKKAGSGVAGANLVTYNSSGGFTYYDSSLVSYGAINATVTAVSDASIPVVSNSGTNGLSAGQVVRLFNIGVAKALSGMDFTVGLNTLTSGTFSLDFMDDLEVAGTTGSWMLVNSNPLYYPRRRFVGGMLADTTTLISLTVRHDYQVGQKVRLSVSDAYGAWSALNGVECTIISIANTGLSNYIEVDVDSSNYGTWLTPVAAGYPFTPAQVVPVGENTALAISEGLNILSDATVNTSEIGMTLGAGANGPAGQNNDVIFWVAGKSFSI